jgi:hypothetical protein
MTMLLIAMFAMPLLLAAFYSWTSRMNHFFFFGKAVPAEFAASSQAKTIENRYRLTIWLGCLPALAACFVLYSHNRFTAGLWAMLIEFLVFNFAFARAHQAASRVAPPAITTRAVEVPLSAPALHPPSMIALLAPLATGMVLLLTSLALLARRSSLAGAPRALDALVAAHGGENMFAFGMGLAFAGLAALLIRGTARSRTPLGQNALWSSMIATWAGVAAMTFAMASAWAGDTISLVESRSVTATFALLALGVVLLRMMRTRHYVPPSAEMQSDASWRWGLFYVNRNDPALFVQCRCGAGYTLNYGRTMAWPLAAVFLACLVVILVTAGQR